MQLSLVSSLISLILPLSRCSLPYRVFLSSTCWDSPVPTAGSHSYNTRARHSPPRFRVLFTTRTLPNNDKQLAGMQEYSRPVPGANSTPRLPPIQCPDTEPKTTLCPRCWVKFLGKNKNLNREDHIRGCREVN
ncbi:hypothetical protein B0T19DRAFT_271590 [Cercophora scortea]|uniref:Secreted protein n=1 Tax=Cercophora scortea TaxID=314031 RepID=A0AAE0M5X6_9PEZI|nr:hypothetical protein B0T19DRAFT_271590 [Cercophora scortea]